MVHLTLYLDDSTVAKVEAAAQAAGVSASQWVAKLIAERTRDAWPDDVASLAGSWKDETIAAAEPGESYGTDIPREPL
ncbi:MAG: DUF6364 family protein [Nannocystaceae bacterium]